MASIPDRLPLPLSERLASASQAIYSRLGREVDVAVGGIPFMLATSAEVPQSVETIPQRKDQFDTEKDPGEQSLTGWWRRSQSSFHQGAGFLYEPNSDDPHEGYWDSSGVNVFERGELTLLKKMVELGPSGTSFSRMRTYATGGTRTNHVTNPSAEVDTTDWAAGGSVPPTLSRSTTRAWTGSASFKAVWGTGGSLPQIYTPGIAAGTATVGATYTVSAYVWVPTGSVDVLIAIPGFDAFFSANTGGLRDQWVRLTKTSTASNTSPAIQIWPSTPPTAGMEVYVDAVMFEEGPVAGPYFDGDSANSAWSGTAHASTSIETIEASAASISAVADGELHKSTTDGDPTSDLVSLHAPAGKTLVDGVIAGTSFYDVASDGTLYQGLISAPGSATSWPCGTTPSRLGWGKHRLWMIGGRKLWQPDLGLSGGTSQSPIFTHPNLGWTYTAMAEGPSAMYFGGHDGFTSSIQAITFDSGGGIPALSGATVTAVLPEGELVQELAVVAGQYIGIGTNRGFRLGVVQQDSSIQYGPLIVEPEGVTACTAITSQGRFFVVGFRASAGENALVYRVDTGTDLGDGVFPYAKDASCEFVGNWTSAVTIGNELYGTTSDGRAWYQSSSELVEEGWIESSRIRFRTTEPKAFKYVDIDIEPLQGAIAVEGVLEGGSTLSLGSITLAGEVLTETLLWGSGPMRYGSLRLTMTRDESTDTDGPTLYSYLVRALPAVAPQRLITLPLLCYDQEQARSGQRYGGDGYSSDRLMALQQLESEALTLVYQDFTSGLNIGQTVVIESMRFVQTTPRDSSTGNQGGILYLQLRTVDA